MPSISEPTDDYDSEETISPAHIIHVLWLRRKIFLAVFLLVFVSCILFVYQLTPIYSANSKILVGTSTSQVVDVDAVLSGNLDRWGAVESEAQVLMSRELAKKVVEKLNLLEDEKFNPGLTDQPPGLFYYANPFNWIPSEMKQGFKNSLGMVKKKVELNPEEKEQGLLSTAVNIYLSNLQVEPIGTSQVISLTFSSPDPRSASKIANAHADMYIINQLDAKFEATEKATSWLNERMADMRSKVEDSEQAVEIYRNKYGLTRGVHDAGLLREQLSEVNSQIIVARAERAEAEARLRQINRLLNSGSDIESAGEVLSSSLIQGLRQQESDLTRRISEMSVEYGLKHPKMIRINAEIKDLQEKIISEISKIARGLKNELEVVRIRESSLRSSLKDLERQSGLDRKEEVQLRALEREAAANRTLFETFLTRFKETSSTQGMHEADARIISKAEIPHSPSYPNTRTMKMISFIAALICASGIVFLLEILNPGIRTPEQVEELLGEPTLGLIPLVEKKDPFDYMIEKPHSGFSEALNSLRISLVLSDPDKSVKTIQITSSVPEEGKSVLALCLARGAALSGQKVVLIDADLRRPSLEKKLGTTEKSAGLTDLVMAQDEQISDYVFKDEHSELYIMPKGRGEHISPADIFTSHRMETIITALKGQFDLIIFDTPPVMAVSDSRALAKRVDKTVFVVRWDHTPRKVIKAGIKQFADQSLAGVVLQKVDLRQYGRYGYGDSGHYYHYGKYGQYYSS